MSIKDRDVITIRIPFPDISDTLATKAHMYTCINSKVELEFLKCQSCKPYHLTMDNPLKHFIIEHPDIQRNPFIVKTIIDCDKSFIVEGVVIDSCLLASRNVCQDLFNKMIRTINHSEFNKEFLNEEDLAKLNESVYLDY